MAQFYELEEAARVLGMDPEDLKAKANDREIRSLRDGDTLRFRVADIDEEARRRKLGSDPELSLSDLDLSLPPAIGGVTGSGEFDLSEFALGVAPPNLGGHSLEMPRHTGGGPGSDAEILLDDLSLPPGPMSGSSSTILGMAASGKLPSDSDVRLMPDNAGFKGASDSDVRLAPVPSRKGPSDSDVTLVNDDPSDAGLDDYPSSPGDTAVRHSPLLGSSAEVPVGDSDFELTPSSVIDALQPESGSDFELTALDHSNEFEATPLKAGPGDSDVTAGDPALSGINLGRPSDSGINLQNVGGLNLGQADSIELAPLSGDDVPVAPKKPTPPAAKPAPARPAVAAKVEKDIFEDTDFEVDALGSDEESDDRTVQLDAASDFELEEGESGSEVFAIDEDDVDQNAATAMAPAVLDDEDDDGFAAVADEVAASGASGWDVESEGGAPARAAGPSMLASSAANADWGGLWVGLLSASGVLVLLLTFVSLDLVRNMYEFQSSGPASGLIKTLAGLISG